MADRNTKVIDRLIEMDRTSPKTILVVGDGMTDVYVHGRLETGQEGCPKFVEQSSVSVPGGAANAARSLKNWQSKILFFHDHRTGPVKTRYMVDGKCVFRCDDDRNNTDFSIIQKEALRVLGDGVVDGVLISDYDKGTMTSGFIRRVIGYCNKVGIPAVADAKREPDLYDGALLKCNEYYAQQHFRSRESKGIVVTRGARGPYWFGATYPEGPSVECVNHVGAGDCFGAHLILALANKIDLNDAVPIAHSAGRVYVQYEHNRPPHPNEIKEDLQSC